MPERPANTVRAVERACDLLDAMHRSGGGGVTELANQLDTSKSTVHNHLTTLERQGYVVKQDGEYSLSYRFLTLGGTKRDGAPFYRIAKDHVDNLAEETGDFAAATTEEAGRNIYLYISTGSEAVSVGIYLGTQLPLHCLASGKAILAALPRDRVETIVEDRGLPAHTPNTITDADALFEELETIRERGYALDNEERIQGMRAVASAVQNEADGSVLGAIVVSGSTNRVQGDYFREELPELVVNRAREIEINATYS